MYCLLTNCVLVLSVPCLCWFTCLFVPLFITIISFSYLNLNPVFIAYFTDLFIADILMHLCKAPSVAFKCMKGTILTKCQVVRISG